MKDKRYMLNTVLAVVVGLALGICMLIRVFLPAAVLPTLNIPNLAALSLITLVLDHYLSKGAGRCYVCVAGFSALTFGLLFWLSGFVSFTEVWKPALVGTVVFTVLTFLFTSIQDRISTGPKARFAPILSAFGLYLAMQCFGGIIL